MFVPLCGEHILMRLEEAKLTEMNESKSQIKTFGMQF